MNILHITSELHPIAKVGGLGDGVAALAKEQIRRGHTVWIALPFYQGISSISARYLFSLALSNSDLHLEIWQSSLAKCQLLLIKDCASSQFFHRDDIYGYSDDISRFCAFSSAVMHAIPRLFVPDAIHMHDWPAAYAALFRSQVFFANISFVLTIHNPENQGIIDHPTLQYFCYPSDSLNKEENPCNGLATAIKRASVVTTVSPQYSKELQEEPAGRGLSTLLRTRAQEGRFYGILNGIDTEVWNPEQDSALICNYNTNTITFDDHPKSRDKRTIAIDLAQDLSFAYDEQQPLIAVLSRLTEQKGINILFEVIPELIQRGNSVIILGKAFHHQIYEQCQAMAKRITPKGRLIFEHNENLAHRLLGAADILIMPSLFEPCGLTQMMAMRYGVLPVVRATGGLMDTVFDVHFSDKPEHERNGFVFMDFNKEGLYSALNRALDAWKYPSLWQRYVRQAMHSLHDWQQAAATFDQLYQYR